MRRILTRMSARRPRRMVATVVNDNDNPNQDFPPRTPHCSPFSGMYMMLATAPKLYLSLSGIVVSKQGR
jgi:hypothetical protein